ncbi:hypothetical protein [Streptomyces beijiangensis]|uniref:Excreted virulence factor EspC, type VII ESX diderm n=1 Tax=Streptomyces beijiangensis TaxID=163361 RepID=A0A939FD91_9ACTN|nr:hypothetical protein [Streptomyces beijiangensis]MBO0515292.1 hypothetical protein [Streptomyces beijiangensis]
MAQGFQVDPDAILKYAIAGERQHVRIPGIASALGGVDVPWGAFGKLPDSDELHASYRDHAAASAQNVQDLLGVMETVVENLRTTAGNYFAVEDVTSETFGGGTQA